MKKTIALLTSISMLFCSVPVFPVTAADTPGETYFLVADRNDNRAILFDLKKDENNPYGYNSYEISDWSTGERRYTAASADWDVGDILLYTGGYSYTELPSPNSNYFIMKEDGSFEEVGVLPDTLQDAVQKDENGCFLYKGDDDATAALVACLKIPEPTEATELPGYPDCLPELINLTTEATEQTDPTEPATITMEEDVPVFVHPRYVVLDKTESFLYLIRFPFEATDREFHSNGIYLPTYVLYNEGVFTETFEQADPGDMLELRDGDLGSTEKSCWNYFILPSDPEDVGHFEWVGNLLGEEAYADNVTEWHSEKHLVFTSKEGSRYVVVANENDYPSFVPENELTEMPTDPTEESVTWTEPVTTAKFCIRVVDA
ncbi:MAG: hypothetical protein K5695_11040, partial [Oscillospiraceae bacterium]|nr:hypothetical protein [Oscillospiraceae bacterium]